MIIIIVLIFLFSFFIPLLVTENLGALKGLKISIITYIVSASILYLLDLYDSRYRIESWFIFWMFIWMGIPLSLAGLLIGGFIRIFTHSEEDENMS
jgi:hypothetical protein